MVVGGVRQQFGGQTDQYRGDVSGMLQFGRHDDFAGARRRAISQPQLESIARCVDLRHHHIFDGGREIPLKGQCILGKDLERYRRTSVAVTQPFSAQYRAKV
jgi:hypothetical protein